VLGLLKPPVAGNSSEVVASKMSKKVALAAAIAKLLEIEPNFRSYYILNIAIVPLTLLFMKKTPGLSLAGEGTEEPRFARPWYLPVSARILAYLPLDPELLIFAYFTGNKQLQICR
jgi:hypothetical protein